MPEKIRNYLWMSMIYCHWKDSCLGRKEQEAVEEEELEEAEEEAEEEVSGEGIEEEEEDLEGETEEQEEEEDLEEETEATAGEDIDDYSFLFLLNIIIY